MKAGLLIQGDDDALDILNDVDHCVGNVKAAYLEPPFDTGWGFQSHESPDQSPWLGMMQKRLRLVRDLLAVDGSVWVRLNDNRLAECHVLMNKVFGRSNFVATIVLQRNWRGSSRYLAVNHDYLLIFAKDLTAWRPNTLPRSCEPDPRYRNPDNDPRGPWLAANLFTNLARPNLQYEVIHHPTGTTFMPPANLSWRFSRQRLEELDKDGRIFWRHNSRPVLKLYLSEAPDEVPRTVWSTAEVGDIFQAKRELRRLLPDSGDRANPQPESLLHRIFTISTNPGDLVLDCLSNSGTAASVAHKTGRRWIAVENGSSDIRRRLDKVIAGEDPGGITEAVNWSGGGSYGVITAVKPDGNATRPPAWAIADEDVRIQVITYRKDEESVSDLDPAEKARRAREYAVIDERRKLLAKLREIVSDKNALEATVQQAIGLTPWIFGGEYVDVERRRNLMPRDQHDIVLVRADRSIHIVELKRPGTRIVKMLRNHPALSSAVTDAVQQCQNYIRTFDDEGPTLEAIHREKLGLDYDYRRVTGTVVIGNPDHPQIAGVNRREVDHAIRAYNRQITGVRVITYLDLIERAEQSLRFDEAALHTN